MLHQYTYRVIVRTAEGHKSLRVRASSETRAALAAVQNFRNAVAISVTHY